MAGPAEQVEELLRSARALPHGPAQIAMCEEAVRLADAENDVYLAYEARHDFVEAAMFGGRPDLMLVAFSWCVAQFDREPYAFDAYSLLWRFKWVVATLPRFPQIDRPTIEKMLQDMEQRFLAFGSSMQPVWLKRRSVAMLLGDVDAAAAAHRKYSRMARSFLSDCHACEIDGLASYWFELGRNANGLKKASVILDGLYRCAEVPHQTYADVLLPLLKVGRTEEALQYHRKGYPMIQRNPEFGRYCAMHATYLALTGNDAKALRLIERHVPDVVDGHDPMREYDFFRYAWLTLEVIAEHKSKAKLRMPKISDTVQGDGEYDLDNLAGAFKKRTLEMASRFDQRNGNDYHTRIAKDGLEWKKCARR